jgi:hypothetical protein
MKTSPLNRNPVHSTTTRRRGDAQRGAQARSGARAERTQAAQRGAVHRRRSWRLLLPSFLFAHKLTPSDTHGERKAPGPRVGPRTTKGARFVSVLLLSRLRVSSPDCALRCCAALRLCIVVRLPKEPNDARRVRNINEQLSAQLGRSLFSAPRPSRLRLLLLRRCMLPPVETAAAHTGGRTNGDWQCRVTA